MKNLRKESIIIAIGLALLGIFICDGLESLTKGSRVVSVRGLAEKEVKADRVIWPIVYKTVGNNITSLYSDMSGASNKIKTFLEKNGISAKEIVVGAPQVDDLWTNEYNNDRNRERYNAKMIVTVTSSDVDKVRNLIARTGELLKEGIAIAPNDYQSRIEYSFTSLNEIKPAMIEEATKNARMAAVKFAKDSESKLGKIKSASQGLFTINNRDANTPFIKEVRVVTTVNYYLKN